MTLLVLGATGATGRLLVKTLLDRGHGVIAPVRSPEKLDSLKEHKGLTLIKSSLSELSDERMDELVSRCGGALSCLGHNLTLKGIYGKPRRLVTDAVKQVCEAAARQTRSTPFKFVLMNTTGNRDKAAGETLPVKSRFVVFLLRHLLPPQADNEAAAAYLKNQVGPENSSIKWVAVRPDNLTDETAASRVEVHPSPVRDPIFDAGQTSRINVAAFMADLISHEELWETWQGRWPVLYNAPAL